MSATVAVTGIGLLTAAGEGLVPIAAALAAGRSALGALPEAVARGLPHRLGGRFPAELVPEAGPDRAVLAALRAARAALAEAALPAGARLALAVGTGLGASERLEALGPGASGALDPELWSPAALGREVGGALSIPAERRRVFVVTCLSSLCALEHARAELELGRADAVLVLGVETLSRTIQAGFSALGALSKTATAERLAVEDGILLGEAACALVVEREEGARGRGARVRVRITGQAMRVDGRHLTSPNPEGEGLAAAIAGAGADGVWGAAPRRDARSAGEGGGPGSPIAAERASLLGMGCGAEPHSHTVLVTAPASPGYAAQYARALGADWRGRVESWEGVTGHCLGASTAVGVAFAAERLGRGAGGSALLLSVGFGGQSGATRLEAP